MVERQVGVSIFPHGDPDTPLNQVNVNEVVQTYSATASELP